MRRAHLRHRYRQLRSNHPCEQGFTLVEVVLIVGILLILASISIPTYSDYIGSFRSINSNFSSRAASATSNAAAALSSAR